MSESPEQTSVFSRLRRDRSESPRHRHIGKERRDGGVFSRLEGKEKNVSAHSESRYQSSRSKKMKPLSESEDSGGRHWKSRSKKQKSIIEEDDPSQPWVCEETDPFTLRIRYFDFLKKTRMPNNVKTYDGSDDPEDHLKIFQEAAKAFLANFLKQLKCIKDPVEIHHIKQREGESTEDFVQRFKAESKQVKGAPECMRISRFMHGITNPELIKRLHDNISKSVDEMMRVTTTFLRGEVAASNLARKKTLSAWKQHAAGKKQNFDRRRDFRN
ncbi:reverse transcriptase domain-containing protein [Tanacetum coccineum]